MKEILKYLRQTHNFTQEEVAEQLHISRQSYNKYEKGTVLPGEKVIQALARLYDVSENLIRQNTIPSIKQTADTSKQYQYSDDTGESVAAEPWFDWTGPFNTYTMEGIYDGNTVRIISSTKGIPLKKGTRIRLSFNDGEKTRESREEVLQNILTVIHRGIPCTLSPHEDIFYKDAISDAMTEELRDHHEN